VRITLIGLVACVVAVAVATDAAADRTPRNVEKLWREYPLEQTPTSAAGAPRPAASRGSSRPAQPTVEVRTSGPNPLLIVLLAVTGATGLGLIAYAMTTKRRERRVAEGAAPPPLAARPRGARPAAPSAPPSPPRAPPSAPTPAGRFERPAAAPKQGRPTAPKQGRPTARRGPVCQIKWLPGRGRSCFAAVVIEADGVERELLRSRRVPWLGDTPPEPTPEAQAAVRAVSKQLREAGWTLMRARGKDFDAQQWYARRFRRRAADAQPKDTTERSHGPARAR
jgi:hypothetical protein